MPTNHVIAQVRFTLHRACGTVPYYGKSGPNYWYCIKFIQRLDEGLRLQLLGKNLKLLPSYTFKLVSKN